VDLDKTEATKAISNHTTDIQTDSWQMQSTVNNEVRGRGTVLFRYQATTGENKTHSEESKSATVICKVRE
jgi:hypothetical protein